MKRKIFKIIVRISEDEECFYVSDGYIVIQNDIFEGYITDDYIAGSFENQRLFVHMLMYDYYNKICNYSEFEDKIGFFELPEMYLLKGSKKIGEQFQIQIDFQENIDNQHRFNEIEGNLKEIKEFYGIPDIQ